MLVGRLYRTADLSVAYPLMRGLAPLIATAIAFAALGERPSALALAGVLALVAGVVGMGASGLAHGRIDRAAARRRAGQRRRHRHLFGDRRRRRAARRADTRRTPSPTTPGRTGLPPCSSARCWRCGAGAAFGASSRANRPRAAAGGVAAFIGYALVVWAMTQAEIGEVAALRECSVVFAALIGVSVARRAVQARAGAATLLILAGVAALKFA